MHETKYRLVFRGRFADHENAEEVKNKVCALLKVEAAAGEGLFTGEKIVLKGNLTLEDALKYQVSFEKTGALSSVEPVEAADGASVATTAEVANCAPEVMSCPKCGYEQQSSASCSNCGLIFAKYGRHVALRHNKLSAKALEAELQLKKEQIQSKSRRGVNIWVPRIFDSLMLLVSILLPIYFFDLNSQPYAPEGSEFSVYFPGYPKTGTNVVNDRMDFIYVSKQQASEFYVCRSVYTKLGYISPERGLEGAKRVLLARGALLQEDDSNLDGKLAKEFTIKLPDFKTERLKVCLDGSTLYQIGVIAPDDEMKPRAVEEFINSFHLPKRKG